MLVSFVAADRLILLSLDGFHIWFGLGCFCHVSGMVETLMRQSQVKLTTPAVSIKGIVQHFEKHLFIFLADFDKKIDV